MGFGLNFFNPANAPAYLKNSFFRCPWLLDFYMALELLPQPVEFTGSEKRNFVRSALRWRGSGRL